MSGPATDRILAMATACYLAGRAVQAEALCGAILRSQPDHVETLYLAALIALCAGRTAEGAVLLRRVLDVEFGHTRAEGSPSDAITAPDEREGAVSAFRRGVALRPDDAGLHVKLGVALCDLDRFDEAEAAYRRAIALEPHLARAHFNLGITLTRQGRLEDAAGAYRAVIALDPSGVDAVLNLGNVLMDQGQLEAAIAAYQRVVAVRPDFAAGHRNLALALHRHRRLDEALAVGLRAVALAPDQTEIHRILGAVLRDLGHFDDAVAAYRYALTLTPNDATLYCGLAATLRHQGLLENAVTACCQATALAPDYIEAHKLMGLVLHNLGRLDDAVAAYRKALALNANDPTICSNLGAALCELGRFVEASAACQVAIAHKPDYAAAHTNLGVVFEAQDRLDDAVAAHRRAIAADPAYAKGYANLAIALRDLGEIDEATNAAQQAIEIEPDEPLARFNHALFLLMNGDYTHGFQEYEWRRRCKALPQEEQAFAVPEWQGEPLAGLTLLLHAERGFGDTLQFVRFIPAVAAMGGAIVLQAQAALVHLLRSLPGVLVIGRGDVLPPFERHLPLMSLPRILGTTLATIPADVPYLHPEPAKLAAWRRRLAGDHNDGVLKVGVTWAGNPKHKADRRRSLAAGSVLPRLLVPGVRLYSLQKEPRPADHAVLAELGSAVTDLAPDLADFSDTAAAIAALDLVIAVDTSAAHLAGALGRPVWTMLPYALDWRWLRERDDSPWYPTMRIFRQPRPGDWDSVISRIQIALTRTMHRPIAANATGPEQRAYTTRPWTK